MEIKQIQLVIKFLRLFTIYRYFLGGGISISSLHIKLGGIVKWLREADGQVEHETEQ